MRYLRLFALTLLILSLAAGAALADGDWEYAVNPDGASVSITRYTGSASSVTVPAMLGGMPVTELGEYAFENNASLSSVVLPAGLERIGWGAFARCTALSHIDIPEGVTYIGNVAFTDCTALSSITLPGTLTQIEAYAFSGCTSLAAVELPDSVTEIGSHLFEDCASLSSVRLPNRLTCVEMNMFSHCTSLTALELPESLRSIDVCAFAGCTGLKSLRIPDRVDSILDFAFEDCESLQEIALPAELRELWGGAFCGCSSLREIVLPDSVIIISDDPVPFDECPAAVYAAQDSLTADVLRAGGIAFTALPAAGYPTLTLPNALTALSAEALSATDARKVVVDAACRSVCSRAFADCARLRAVEFRAADVDIALDAFVGCGDSLLLIGPGGSDVERFVEAYMDSSETGDDWPWLYFQAL